MLFGIAESIGRGLCFFFSLAMLATGLALWVIYWSCRRFRARLRPEGRGWRWWLTRVGPVVAVMVLFPPMRRAGNWQDAGTGAPIPAYLASDVDRKYFGVPPVYGWVGNIAREEDRAIDRGRYQCTRVRWVLDWPYVAGQSGAFVILLLPFIRACRKAG